MALVNLVTIVMGFVMVVLALVVLEDLKHGEDFYQQDEDYLQGVSEGTLENEGASK